ncbi:Phage terminase-like protein, large subunit, contains N-terminal HTH domain [Saccharopolyspora shandongensis]|uniref:Phage terminase-like protein, large subunit, contains N-terminal HTH domain n=1 Tax=Saccharopolyspora shandongensis TaxID=418495 RepID=A0A1H3TYG4_9PSEU|nr:hypothetical protein [Saccharopolyspora shandongensis]SDZ55266.1 Phage terminase-like protein, large subunit, contains N-terminal HTH domain [Saccharopolyspora shandongensis]
MLTSPPGSLRGARHPRVEITPPYVDTYGPEAIELARRAGLELDFWQQQAITLMLASRDDGKWACFEYAELVARQNGKGGILEARVLAGLFLLGERLIMWSAHEYKTAMEAFLRVRALIMRLIDEGLVDADAVKVNNTNGEEGFELLGTGQRLKFIARSKSSGRGFSGDLNIIDEAFAYTPAQHAALMPTMSARPNPQIIYTSSPPLDGESGDVLFGLRARAEAGGDDSLGYRDWGAAGDLDHLDALDLDDRQLWAATNPAVGVRITEETIARERRSMTAVDFARERLGVWPRRVEGGGAIDVQQWAKLADPDSQAGDDVVFAVEVAYDRSTSSIAAWSVRADGLGHAEVIDQRPGTDWVVGRLVELRDRWNPVAFGVDGKGPALSLVFDLEAAGIKRPGDPEKPGRGDLAVLSLPEMAAACGQLLDAIAQGTFRHLDDPDLNAAAAGAATRPVGDVEVWGRRNATAEISPLTAVTVARRVYMTRIDAIKKPKRKPLAAWA